MRPREMLILRASACRAIWEIAFKLITTGLAAVPLAGLTWKTFNGYKRAVKDCDSERTKNLYFLNLANNAPAVHMLTTVVAEEEVKEALLAYAFCRADKLEDERGALQGRGNSAMGLLEDAALR